MEYNLDLFIAETEVENRNKYLKLARFVFIQFFNGLLSIALIAYNLFTHIYLQFHLLSTFSMMFPILSKIKKMLPTY